MTRMLKLALVSAFPPGRQSLNEYGWHLAHALAARPDVQEVVILADRLDEALPEPSLPNNIRIERVWRFNRLGTVATLLRALRRTRPDAVIYNLQMASFGDREVPAALGLYTPMLSRLMGLPSGVIAHNLVSGVDLEQTNLKGRPLRQALVRIAARVVTGALCHASYVTTTLKGYYDHLAEQYPRARTALVPHGAFDTEKRPWVEFQARPRRIVTMGKFGTYKKLHTLLAAFDRLRADPEFADYTLEIGGSDHPAASGYMATLQASRSEDHGVIFKGYVAEEEIPEFFESAQLSVFDYESTTGSSGVLHQTASYGAVPVFPRIGDFVDICQDEGLRGYHYDPGSVEQMTEAMARALRNPDASGALARSNRTAAEDLPISSVAAWHIEHIGALLDGRDATWQGPALSPGSAGS